MSRLPSSAELPRLLKEGAASLKDTGIRVLVKVGFPAYEEACKLCESTEVCFKVYLGPHGFILKFRVAMGVFDGNL